MGIFWWTWPSKVSIAYCSVLYCICLWATNANSDATQGWIKLYDRLCGICIISTVDLRTLFHKIWCCVVLILLLSKCCLHSSGFEPHAISLWKKSCLFLWVPEWEVWRSLEWVAKSVQGTHNQTHPSPLFWLLICEFQVSLFLLVLVNC